MDQSASDRREKLGQREAGAAGEVQSGESSVGAETERGHCTTGKGMMGCGCLKLCVCARERESERESEKCQR